MIETSDMQFEERMVTPREVEEDREAEVTLRPQTLVGSRAAVRASGTGKDDTVLDHRPRNGRESSCDDRSGN